MSFALPWLIVGLPFVSAVVLSLIASWRFGAWFNAASASVVFLLACFLPSQLGAGAPLFRIGPPEAHLALLTSFVAMTASWFGYKDIALALAAQRIDRRRSRLFHIAYQVFICAALLGLLSGSPAVTWFAVVVASAAGAILTGVASTNPARRLVLLSAAGLLLASFATLLLYLAAEPGMPPLDWQAIATRAGHLNGAVASLAGILLLLGYGTVIGLVLPQVLPPDGLAPGAILVGSLLMNVPLLVIVRLRAVLAAATGTGLFAGLLVALGLATLLLAAFDRARGQDVRGMVARTGSAQIGLVVFAFGLGTPAAMFAGWFGLTVLTLARAAVLQCENREPTRAASWAQAASILALPSLLLVMLFDLAGPAADRSPWLLVPLALGVLLLSVASINQLARQSRSTGGGLMDTLALTPIWLQLAIALILALAMPNLLLAWFRGVADAG